MQNIEFLLGKIKNSKFHVTYLLSAATNQIIACIGNLD